MLHLLKSVFGNKSVWQGIIALLMLMLFAYFVKNQHLELRNIGEALLNSDSHFILLGLVFTVFFVLLQAGMYVYSFKAVGANIPLYTTLILYFKRNLVSVFLPAGGLSSLAFFGNDLKKHQTDSTQVYFASFLYGLCSLVSVVIVGFPIIFFLLLRNDLNQATALGFVFLIILISIVFVISWSVYKRRWLYQKLVSWMPKLVVMLEGISTTKVNKGHFAMVGLFSILVEVVGIVHIYIAILALGMQPGLEVATVAYVVMIILLLASPFLRGLGAIEVSMAYIFMQYGYNTVMAAGITLLFRLFEFWIPLFGGVLSFVFTRDNLFRRLFPPLLVFSVGMYNILSSVSPGLQSKLGVLDPMMPEILANLSNNIILLSGILLCIVSYYLLIGSRNAWRMAVLLSVVSVAGNFTRQLEIKEIIFSFFTFGVLLFTRGNYRLRNHFVFRQKGIVVFSILLVSLASYTLLGIYFIDKRHIGHEFTFAQSFDALIDTLVVFSPPQGFSASPFGRFFVQSVYIAQLFISVYLIYILLQPRIRRQPLREHLRNKAFQLAGRYSSSSLDYIKLQPYQKLFLSRKVEGFVAFRNIQEYTMVYEGPISRNAHERGIILREFYDFCHENGRTLLLYKAGDSENEILGRLGMKNLLIGQRYTLSLHEIDFPVRYNTDGYTARLYIPPHSTNTNELLKKAFQPEILRRVLSEVSQDFVPSDMFAYITIEMGTQIAGLATIQPPLSTKSPAGLEVLFMRNIAPTVAGQLFLVKWKEYCQRMAVSQAECFNFDIGNPTTDIPLGETVKQFDLHRIPAIEHRSIDDALLQSLGIPSAGVYLLYEEDTDLLVFPSLLQEIKG